MKDLFILLLQLGLFPLACAVVFLITTAVGNALLGMDGAILFLIATCPVIFIVGVMNCFSIADRVFEMWEALPDLPVLIPGSTRPAVHLEFVSRVVRIGVSRRSTAGFLIIVGGLIILHFVLIQRAVLIFFGSPPEKLLI